MSWKDKLKNLVLAYVENAGYKKFEENAIYFAPNWNRKITVEIDEGSLNVPPILMFTKDQDQMFYLKHPFNIYERMDIPIKNGGAAAKEYQFTDDEEHSFTLSIHFNENLSTYGFSNVKGLYIDLSNNNSLGNATLTFEVYDKNNNLIGTRDEYGAMVIPYDAKEFTIFIKRYLGETEAGV